MEIVSQLDEGIRNATQLYFLIIGIWGLLRAIRGQPVDSSYLGMLAIGAGLFVVELILDVVLYFGGVVPERAALHYLYAVFAAILIPFIYASVLKGEDSNQAQWIYAFVTLFLWGVVQRAMVTGAGG